jgi:hypothetical protein
MAPRGRATDPPPAIVPALAGFNPPEGHMNTTARRIFGTFACTPSPDRSRPYAHKATPTIQSPKE